MPKPRLDYTIGDIVQWVPGKKYDKNMPNGPFLVLEVRQTIPNPHISVRGFPRGERLADGSCTGFLHWRFRKDEFLTAVKHAKNKVRSR